MVWILVLTLVLQSCLRGLSFCLAQFECETLQPYRSIRADEVVLHGHGTWPLEQHLDADLYLPYVEPEVIRFPGQSSASPSFAGESKDELLRLCKVWDAAGLLGPIPGPLPRLMCISGSVTDRRDFHTQAGVSLERSLTNACGPALPLS